MGFWDKSWDRFWEKFSTGAWKPIQKDFCGSPKLGDPPKLGNVSKGAACINVARAKLGWVGRSSLGDRA